MKKSLIALAVVTIAVGSMGFGIMIGATYDVVGWGAISIGTEIGNNMFAYAGISFPFGATVGGGMKLGNLYTTDLGTTTENKKIGKLDIGYGAVASGSVELFPTEFGAFAGPALFVNFESQLPGLEYRIMSYTALGAALTVGEGSFPISFDWTSGFFYYF